MENKQIYKEMKHQVVEEVEACRSVCDHRFKDFQAYESQCITDCLYRFNVLTTVLINAQNNSDPTVIRLPHGVLYRKHL
jgi:hypothetical protein